MSEAKVLVESYSVNVVLRHMPEDAFHPELVERVVENDEQHVAVDPVLVPGAGMDGDRLCREVGEDHAAETNIVLDPADRDVPARVEGGAGALRDRVAVILVVEFDVIQCRTVCPRLVSVAGPAGPAMSRRRRWPDRAGQPASRPAPWSPAPWRADDFDVLVGLRDRDLGHTSLLGRLSEGGIRHLQLLHRRRDMQRIDRCAAVISNCQMSALKPDGNRIGRPLRGTCSS